MQSLRPELGVLEHLPLRETHDRVDVAADEAAPITVRCLIGVHDAGRDRQEILQAAACLVQLDGALLDPLLQFVVGFLEFLLRALSLTKIGGEADRSDLYGRLRRRGAMQR